MAAGSHFDQICIIVEIKITVRLSTSFNTAIHVRSFCSDALRYNIVSTVRRLAVTGLAVGGNRQLDFVPTNKHFTISCTYFNFRFSIR